MKAHFLNGDVMKILIADKSIHCIITSPPYWALRSYSTGDQKSKEIGSESLHDCGAWLNGKMVSTRPKRSTSVRCLRVYHER